MPALDAVTRPAPTTPLPARDPFASLNEAQLAAVAHDLAPGAPPGAPLLIIAGAGTGKTMTLAARVARLVMAGADPQRLLLLTFSRRAAQEMTHRAGRLLHQALGWSAQQPPPALPWAGTFHGIGARLLREVAPHIGLSEHFTIHDRGDAEDLMALMRQELGLAASRERFPQKGTCLAIYSRVVNSQATLSEVLHTQFPWCANWEGELKRLFRAYVQEKQRQQALDFDDLLLYWWQAVQEPALASEIGARFDHVLVDEYQDTNRLQAAILRALKPDGRGVTVVGDDAQSIYAFRAAQVRNILDFPHQFQPPARIVALERNYRSTQPILAASNAVIALSPQRHDKALWTDRIEAARPRLVHVEDDAAQARWVADGVLAQREQGIALKRQAVLFRASHHSAALELELTRRRIPFVKYGGLKFLEAAHVKDVLAVLRWAQNPRSRMAGMRVALLVPGIGPAGARRLLDAMQAAPDPVAALRDWKPPAPAQAAWAAWCDTYLPMAADPHGNWPADLERARRWYAPHLQRLHDDAAVREADLAQLAQIARGHATRERFLTELTLDPPEATSDEAGPPLRDEDYLILSTLHSAKGQEWHAVSILNVVDGCIPSDMATGHTDEIEEERRLLYVGMTRAREQLDLLIPQRFYVTQQGSGGGRHLYGQLSRFVPPEVAALFERVAPLPEAPTSCTSAAAGPPAMDAGQRIRALWD